MRRRLNGRFGGQRALCADASGAGLAGVRGDGHFFVPFNIRYFGGLFVNWESGCFTHIGVWFTLVIYFENWVCFDFFVSDGDRAIMFNKLCKEKFLSKRNMSTFFGQTGQKRPFADSHAILGIPCLCPYIPYTFKENTCLRGICHWDVNDLLDTNELSSNFLACTLAGLCLDWSFLLLQEARTRIPTGTLFVSCMGRKETSPIKWMIKPHQMVGLDQDFIWSSYHLPLQTLNIPLMEAQHKLEVAEDSWMSRLSPVNGEDGRLEKAALKVATCVDLSRSKHCWV